MSAAAGAPTLLYGSRAPDSLPAGTTLDTGVSDALVIENAEILYLLHELPMAAAEALLPPSLHPSVPAVFGVTFVRATDGPLGPFTMAWLGIACRTGIKPRHLVLSAFCDGDAAAQAFAARYGFACETAAVTCRETFDRVHGTVVVDGHSVLETEITDSIPLVGAGATIKYSPPLNAAQVNGNATLVQFEAAYEFRRVLRGRPRFRTFDAARLGSRLLTPTTPIAGSHAVVDLHLLPVRFEVDPRLPAEQGGARKIAR